MQGYRTPGYRTLPRFPDVWVPRPCALLEWDTDDRLLGPLGQDKRDPIEGHWYRREHLPPPPPWIKQDHTKPKPPPVVVDVSPVWHPIKVRMGRSLRRKLKRLPEGYRTMEELESDARLFVYAVGSQYFNDVFDALHAELQVSNPPQANALSMLRIRFGQMRELLEHRLDLQQRDAALDAPIPAQEAPGGDHHPD